MERVEDKSWEGEEAVTAGVYCLPAEEDPLFGREAGMQALRTVSHSLCLQGYYPEGGTTHGLYGDAG